MKTWYVYLLECVDKTLYCGVTTDPARRLLQHNGTLKGGARYTHSRRPVSMLIQVAFPSKSLAMKTEAMIKRQPRHKKLACLKALE